MAQRHFHADETERGVVKRQGRWVRSAKSGTKRDAQAACRTCAFCKIESYLHEGKLAYCSNPKTKIGEFSRHPIGFITLSAPGCDYHEDA